MMTKVQTMLRNIFYIVLGTFGTLPTLIVYAGVALLFLFIRYLVKLLLSKCFNRKYSYQKMMSTGLSTAYALEFLSSVSNCKVSRNTILSSSLIEGLIPYSDCVHIVKTGWVEAKKDDGNLKFPEFQNYVDIFMGYCYWARDTEFCLDNHMIYHELNDEVDLDEFIVDLFEKLFNKPFSAKRSPWEVHIVHGWNKDKIRVTILVTRTHHALADGLSVMSAVVQGFMKRRIIDLQVVSPAITNPNQRLDEETGEIVESYITHVSCVKNVFKKVVKVIKLVCSLLYDLGCITWYALWRAAVGTKFHVGDSRKTWQLSYERSRLIEMEKVKRIGKFFGVRFTSVVLSCIAVGISTCFEKGKVPKKDFLIAAPRPLPGHSLEKLVNHLTGTAYKIPVSLEMDPKERLLKIDKTFRRVSTSLSLYVFPIMATITSFYIAPLGRFLYKNRRLGTCLTNICGPRIATRMGEYGTNVLGVNAAVGPFDGVAGLILLLFSYDNNFYLNGVSENASLSKQELQMFMEVFTDQIDYLHDLAMKEQANIDKSHVIFNNNKLPNQNVTIIES